MEESSHPVSSLDISKIEIEEKLKDKLAEQEDLRSESDGESDSGESQPSSEKRISPWKTGVHFAPADSSLFVKLRDMRLTVVLVYVDDLIITGDDEREIHQIWSNLSVRFQMKELGELKHFLGLEIDRTKDVIFLCQQKYAHDVLENFGLLDCKPVSTPTEDVTMYRQLVGSLIYVTLPRPDIAYFKSDLEAIRRILRYVKGSIDHGILYPTTEVFDIHGYCDSDYTGDHETRRSTTGYVSSLGSGADLHQPVGCGVNLYCDNMSAMQLAENPVFHARIKHVEVHYHFVREKVLRVANIFTKGLSGPKFEKLRIQLCNTPNSDSESSKSKVPHELDPD
ncbi:hypothetical protein RND81_07G036200 [Saponaria officinalis]|uniref:Reverse transcriptase Ty1/copia-type domain-containing protein n=1 Tax=Saponaria officinalis TaxID=3572 RepID=A0AAW1JKE6_SAPOF